MSEADRFQQISELFSAACKIEEHARDTFLDQQCNGDDELKQEVLSLLAEDNLEPSLIDRPALGDAPSVKQLAIAAQTMDQPLPEKIGDYRIVRRIGVGGMGVVYEAQQQNPLRTVALKVINAGFLSDGLLRRFEQETQVLGRLQHPGIAQIYEADAHDAGAGLQPFFAMEYVQGETITNYVKTHNLTTNECLELIAKTCDAVQHAHQRGVIHRDLKPNNIYVVETESGPQPKILDFGVARATDADIHATTINTNVGQLIGTVPYMSPEQAAGDPTEIDTRSDVYALGVLTYELLTGRLPYDVQDKLVHEAVRVIREDEPVPLSSIDRSLGGDVWTIIRKALEKDKDRRYESASSFSADIRRYLNYEMISARPPSAVYQLRKFTRRNRTLVAGIAMTFLAMTIGTVAATWQAVRATSAHRNEETARQDAEQVVEALARMFYSPNPSLSGKDVKVIDVLNAASKTVHEDWGDRPLTEARLRATFGLTYMTLGDYEIADVHIQGALDIRRDKLGLRHLDTLQSMHDLVKLRNRQGRTDESEPLLVEVYEARREILGESDRSTIVTMSELGVMHLRHGNLDKAEPLLTRALTLSMQHLGEGNIATHNAINYLARLRSAQGNAEEAEQLFLRSIELHRDTLGPDHPHTINYVATLARFYTKYLRFTEARPLFHEIIAARLEILGEKHPSTLLAMYDLGRTEHGDGNFAVAEPLYKQALDGRNEVLGPDHPATLLSIDRMAVLYIDQERYEDALPLTQQAVSRAQSALPANNQLHGTFLSTLGQCLVGLERYGEAEATLLTAHMMLIESVGGDNERTQTVARQLVDLYKAWGNPTEESRWQKVVDGA